MAQERRFELKILVEKADDVVGSFVAGVQDKEGHLRHLVERGKTPGEALRSLGDSIDKELIRMQLAQLSGDSGD